MAARALQVVTNRLDVWAAKRGLTFSTSKTISMTFRKRNEEPLEIKLRNETIPFKESTQFLGMTLHSRLNWEEHINNLKAKRALNTMKAIAGKSGVVTGKP